jgi:hypothetical protein
MNAAEGGVGLPSGVLDEVLKALSEALPEGLNSSAAGGDHHDGGDEGVTPSHDVSGTGTSLQPFQAGLAAGFLHSQGNHLVFLPTGTPHNAPEGIHVS